MKTEAADFAKFLQAEKQKWTTADYGDFGDILKRLEEIRKRQLEDIKSINSLLINLENEIEIKSQIKVIRQRVRARRAA